MERDAATLNGTLMRAEQTLDGLRMAALRLNGERRRQAECRLDQARGLLNRAHARLEELRRADDGARQVPAAKVKDAMHAVAAAIEAIRLDLLAEAA